MITTSVKNPDRRNYPRETINNQIKYRFYDDTAYSEGKLLDLSQTGALIELRHKLPENTRLSILSKVDDTDEPPIEIIAEIVRRSEAKYDNHYAYGCLILDVINF